MSETYWSEEKFLRPSSVSDDVWHQILNNFYGSVPDPVSDLSTALQDDVIRLQSMGLQNPSDLAALEFEFEQAGDFGSLAERGQEGALGQGWSSLADIQLSVEGDGTASISGLINAGLLSSLNATQTAQYVVSVPLGKIIDQSGGLPLHTNEVMRGRTLKNYKPLMMTIKKIEPMLHISS